MIVVLVILAILAAIMVPQLVGYIDKAKERNYQVRASAILTAAQSVLDEEYAYQPAKADNTTGFDETIDLHDKTDKIYNAILKLAEEKDAKNVDINKDDPAKITKLTTVEGSYRIDTLVITFGKSGENKMTYTGGKWLALNAETEASPTE